MSNTKLTEIEALRLLVQYVLPVEFTRYFDIVNIIDIGGILQIYLDESAIPPEEYRDIDLSSNGFYEASTIKDFPLRERKVVLQVRRRRWVDSSGKSYSRDWELVAKGTRYSKEFAAFLKEAFGFIPDSDPVS
jgi:hypothetical protein